MKGLLAVVLGLAFCSISVAQERSDPKLGMNRAEQSNAPPELDVEAHCSVIASMTGTSSEFMRQTCYQQEQQSYDHLKGEWPTISESIKSYCENMDKSLGPASYFILDTCVDQEVQSASQNRGFRLKR